MYGHCIDILCNLRPCTITVIAQTVTVLNLRSKFWLKVGGFCAVVPMT